MPFTPLHLGPGILIKATLRKRFSLMVFAYSQIIIDIQPLLTLLTGEGHLHGLSHTWLGATGIGLFCGITGKPLGEIGLKQIPAPEPLAIRWRIAFGSAFIGTYSHVFLDSLMHADLQPLAPFDSKNAMLGLISSDALQVFCLVSALAGGAIYWFVGKRHQKRACG